MIRKSLARVALLLLTLLLCAVGVAAEDLTSQDFAKLPNPTAADFAKIKNPSASDYATFMNKNPAEFAKHMASDAVKFTDSKARDAAKAYLEGKMPKPPAAPSADDLTIVNKYCAATTGGVCGGMEEYNGPVTVQGSKVTAGNGDTAVTIDLKQPGLKGASINFAPDGTVDVAKPAGEFSVKTGQGTFAFKPTPLTTMISVGPNAVTTLGKSSYVHTRPDGSYGGTYFNPSITNTVPFTAEFANGKMASMSGNFLATGAAIGLKEDEDNRDFFISSEGGKVSAKWEGTTATLGCKDVRFLGGTGQKNADGNPYNAAFYGDGQIVIDTQKKVVDYVVALNTGTTQSAGLAAGDKDVESRAVAPPGGAVVVGFQEQDPNKLPTPAIDPSLTQGKMLTLGKVAFAQEGDKAIIKATGAAGISDSSGTSVESTTTSPVTTRISTIKKSDEEGKTTTKTAVDFAIAPDYKGVGPVGKATLSDGTIAYVVRDEKGGASVQLAQKKDVTFTPAEYTGTTTITVNGQPIEAKPATSDLVSTLNKLSGGTTVQSTGSPPRFTLPAGTDPYNPPAIVVDLPEPGSAGASGSTGPALPPPPIMITGVVDTPPGSNLQDSKYYQAVITDANGKTTKTVISVHNNNPEYAVLSGSLFPDGKPMELPIFFTNLPDVQAIRAETQKVMSSWNTPETTDDTYARVRAAASIIPPDNLESYDTQKKLLYVQPIKQPIEDKVHPKPDTTAPKQYIVFLPDGTSKLVPESQIGLYSG